MFVAREKNRYEKHLSSHKFCVKIVPTSPHPSANRRGIQVSRTLSVREVS